MSITQQLAHWFIALGLDPAMGALLALILLVAVPLMLAAGVVALFEDGHDENIHFIREARL